ncbi:MAG TPA: glycosyltransferase family 4 protein [Lacibacter sp.]|nr:glycosyltransferase family 4 protein [Lacibacter sp.]
MPRNIHFLVLSSFSSMGGIEKFNRAFMKAFTNKEAVLPCVFTASGLYDSGADDRYIDPNRFRAFHGKRWWFVVWNFISSFRKQELILGHINLAILGVLYKWFRPSQSLTVICHGIEVFAPLTGMKRRVLQQANRVLAVSAYTKEQLIHVQHLDAQKIHVFPNTLDPFFQLPASFAKPDYLVKRYGIRPGEKLLFTLTRLNSEEGYKGYDQVIRSLPALIQKGYSIKYILGGKADANEEAAVTSLIRSLGLEQEVVLAGYIPDEEVTDHYLLSDVFVMPSKGEGFGIVYLEAMACGVPVIAGNKDGSTEALQFGKLGTLIDPDDTTAIAAAIDTVLQTPAHPLQLQQEMLDVFSFARYEQRLQQVFLN